MKFVDLIDPGMFIDGKCENSYPIKVCLRTSRHLDSRFESEITNARKQLFNTIGIRLVFINCVL